MSSFVDELAKFAFGREKSAAHRQGVCVCCGSTKMSPEFFSDELSRREAEITQLCQRCQDDLYSDVEE